MTEATKIQELVQKLNEYAAAYYNADHPLVSDKEYDALYDKLEMLEKRTGIILSNSPTQHPGGEVLDVLIPVAHTKPMLSAAKTKEFSELKKFIREGFVPENPMPEKISVGWKEDGLTLVLRYQNGDFVQAITRGDGITGEDVTHTVRFFKGVPMHIPFLGSVEVRGEGLISWSDFKTYNDLHPEDDFSHPRNMASGNVRKLDAASVKDKNLQFIAFELVSPQVDTKQDEFNFLAQQGFRVVEHGILTFPQNEEDWDKTLEQVVTYFDPEGYDMPVDGLIFEYASTKFGRTLGSTGHHENCRIALKWQDETYKTEFLGVRQRTTRTGMVSLTANFKPVKIEGSVVEHATLHNLNFFEALKLGVGDTISIYKANKIIPAIDSNDTQSGTYRLNMTCPCCGHVLEIHTSEHGTRTLHCPNQDCPARKIAQFEHFVSKPAANIEGLSASKLEDLLDEGFVRIYGDLYRLDRYKTEIEQLPGWGKRSYAKLMKALEKSRDMDLAHLIPCFGIPMVGKHAGKVIERKFHGDPQAFMQAVQDPGFDLHQIPDFGDVMCENLRTFFMNESNLADWNDLMGIFRFKEEVSEVAVTDSPIAGKTVVATGSFEHYTRTGINETIEKYGGLAKSSVSKKTDFVVAGEAAGSKLTKAQDLGIRILTEDEFRTMIGEV